MSYLLGIPYVNRPDLLLRALESVRQHSGRTYIIDNSYSPEFPEEMFWIGNTSYSVKTPGVPLSLSQSINLIFRMAKEQACDYALFMHSDACAVDNAVHKLLNACAEQKGKWGVLFTDYDALCAFNMKAVEEVGIWDTILPQYFADMDYYRRLRLAGWETRETGINVLHEKSATVNSDAKLALLNRVTYPLYREYYRQKWNGFAHEEKWDKPFDGALDAL